MTWGCDKPAVKPVYHALHCVVCGGGLENCESCQGTNRVAVYRCPQSQIDRNTERLMAAYMDLIRYGQFPVEGTRRDQAEGFSKALGLIELEHGLIESEQRDEDERKAAVARARKRAGGR